MLRDNEELRLYERHSSYLIIAQISHQPAGIKVTSTFDASSFGDGINNETYFIPAK